jgi:hypothetical protein
MNRSSIGCTVVAAMALVCMSAGGGPPGPASGSTSDLEKELTSGDPNAQSNPWLRLATERERVILCLLRLAQTGTRKVKGRAIEMLGNYRASEAAPLLVENLETSYGGSFGSFPDPLMHSSAAKALLEIGEPGIRELLWGRVCKPMTESELKTAAIVVRLHYARTGEQEVGLFRMQRLLEQERAKAKSDPHADANLSPSTRERNLKRLIEVY